MLRFIYGGIGIGSEMACFISLDLGKYGQLYNPSQQSQDTRQWKILSTDNGPPRLIGHSMIAHDKRIFLIGGRDSLETKYNSIFCYDTGPFLIYSRFSQSHRESLVEEIGKQPKWNKIQLF